MGVIKIILAFFLFYWLYGAVAKLFSAATISGRANKRSNGRDYNTQNKKAAYHQTNTAGEFEQKKRKMESDLSEVVDFEEIK